MQIKKFSNFEPLNEEENLWGDIKYGISKLGRYKANGKIFGKGKTDKETAEEIGMIMGNTSNAALKAVYDEVKKQAPEWPNDRRRITFLRGIIMYGQFYDSIVAAAEKDPNEDGYLNPEVANKIIENLRKVVKKALDTDLAAVYSVMDSKNSIDLESEERFFEEISQFEEDDAINEEFIKKLGEWKDKAMDALFGKKDEDSEQRIGGNRQSAKLQGAGDNEVVDSERMKTLKSNKLPLVLAGIGGALGALGWIAQTQWFKDLITTTIEHPAQFGEKTITTTVENNLKVDPNGWSYTIQNNGFMDATGKSLNFNQPVGNLKDAFEFYGGGDQEKGIEAMSNFLGGGNKGASVADITSQLADPSNKTVGDVFNHLEGTWGDNFLMNQNGGAKSFIAKQVYTQTKRVLIKAGFTTTTTSAVGGYLVSIAPVLSALGITLIGAGAVVKLLREKGQRQSRAKTLNDLLQSLVLVKVDDKKSSDDESSDESGSEDSSSVSEKSIYPLMIKNLKALQSMIISFDGVGIEGENSSKNLEIKRKNQKELDKVKRQKEKVRESILTFPIFEKEFSKQPRKVEIKKDEVYLVQAFKNISKSLQSLKDEKDKGIGITNDFIGDILDKKMDSDAKDKIKSLYQDVYDYLYGKNSKTLSDFGPLYKENVETISNNSKRKVVAEKIARLSKRTLQFEGEGFYSALGEFGADMDEFNQTLNDIMDYYKSNQVKENKIYRFKDL
jgi:hypothetical protein